MHQKSKKIIHANDLKTVLQLVQSPPPIVLCFVAQWSGTSELLSTVIADLMNNYNQQVRFSFVDIDEQKEINSYFAISNIPTMLFFKAGEVMDYYEGAISDRLLRDKLDNLLDK